MNSTPTPGLDRFLELKENKVSQTFIFLLEEEASWLDEETCWVHHLRSPVHLIRLSDEEFKILDIGVHPKTVITKAGKEIQTFNGVPRVQVLKKILSSLS
jgi:hypothetical protein